MNKDGFKKLINDYFRFNKAERRGYTALSVILFFVMALNLLADKINFSKSPDFTEVKLMIAKLEAEEHEAAAGKHQHLFAFDPNTIDAETLDTLALPLSIKNNLIRYRDRGGKFRNREDLRKLYGMTDSIYAAIYPFVELAVAGEPAVATRSKENIAERSHFLFDPNNATDEELRKLGFSEQQLKNLTTYRDKGGKFRKKEDLARIYGIDERFYSELEPWISIAPEETPQSAKAAVDVAKQIAEIEINT
ncbi:MAG: helix-hairpin-helix domain-containing protein, partial [Prolixibacteraceae bacterium]|nr:helix-hairpin-helix domain-containing protein [Prolixibacteraceae bacterium]